MSLRYPRNILSLGNTTGASVYFNGSSLISAASNAAFAVGTGDFQIDLWVYLTAYPAASGYAAMFSTRTGGTGLDIQIYNNAGTYTLMLGNPAGGVISANNAVPLNAWTLITASRVSGVFYLLVNGATVTDPVTSSQNFTDTGCYIGAGVSGNNKMTGYLSNVRLIKGSALNTSNFVLPTAFQAVTGTSILACQNTQYIVDASSNAFALSTTGSPTVSALTPFTNGYVSTPSPTTLAGTQGVWTLNQSAYWISQNLWPRPTNFVSRSLRFNSADSTYLSWTPAQTGNQRTWTWSGWVKRSALAATQGIFEAYSSASNITSLYFTASDTMALQDINGATYNLSWASAAVFRDVSSWYHVVLAYDATQASSANATKIYINGVQQTLNFTASTGAYSQNRNTWVNSVISHRHGLYNNTNYLNGYITEVNFIDGLALDASYFGATDAQTGTWNPVVYSGSYGNNGFYLNFSDNSTLANLGRNFQPLTQDPYFPYTTLLLNGNALPGLQTAQNNTFLDSSSNNFTITRNGNTTQGTFSPFSQTGWGNYFSGSDYLSVASNAVFGFGTGDLTLEGWFYSSSSSGQYQYIDCRGSSYTNTALCVFQLSGSYAVGIGTTQVITGGSVLANQWVHIAVTRSGTSLKLFVNGTQSGSTYTDSNNYSAFGINIGNLQGASGWNYTGYASNVRITKGGALYTGTFTPSTTPLTTTVSAGTVSLLTCQSNRFIDNSSNAFAITANGTPSVQAFSPFLTNTAYTPTNQGGSGYFDGTGDYLSAPNNTAFDLSTADFTINVWVYPTQTASLTRIIEYSNGTASNSNYAYYLIMVAGGVVRFGSFSGTGTLAVDSTVSLVANAWNYITVTRSGTSATVYVNNVSNTGTVYATFNNPASSLLYVGTGSGTLNPFTGYLSGARIIKGTATAPGTNPTSPPTPITNTQLLLNFTNGAIVDATGKNVLETVGTAQISTTQSKFGGSSLYFNGTTAYINTKPNPLINLGTSNFTLEFWIYPSNFSGISIPIYSTNAGAKADVFALQINATTGLMVAYVSGTATWNIINSGSIGTLTAGTWQHVAFVRNGSDFRGYINGVQSASLATSTAAIAYFDGLTIGQSGASSYYFPGYLDDIRFTRYARYTGNFTPPTAQFAWNQADINVKQWVPNNFSVTAGTGNDSLVDSPMNYGTDLGAGGEVRGNYCTLNPLKGPGALTNGNLDWTFTSAGYGGIFGTVGMSSGKWYWEATVTTALGSSIGIATEGYTSLTSDPGLSSSVWMYYSSGQKYNGTGTAYGGAMANGDVIGVAFDADLGSLTFYKNGVSQGTAFSSLAANTYFPLIGDGNGSATPVISVNFGQRTFSFPAPTGFKALCTQNLP